MGGLLKYLLPFIFITVFFDGTDRSADTVLHENYTPETTVSEAVCNDCLLELKSDLYLPQLSSLPNTKHLRNNNRKTNGTARNNIIFANNYKSGNPWPHRHYFQQKFTVPSYRMIGVAQQLFVLCKLTI